MKIQIDLAEDKELREFIKTQVVAALKSIVREEIRAVVSYEINKKVGKSDVEAIARYEIRAILRAEEKNARGNSSTFLNNIVRLVTAEEVGKLAIKEVEAWATDEKIQAIVSFRSIAESIIREKIEKVTKDLGTLDALRKLTEK